MTPELADRTPGVEYNSGVAIVQLKCPETGKPVDVWRYNAGDLITAHAFSKPIPCPHCGKEHAWTSSDRGLAVRTLQSSPDATRVLGEGERGNRSATALP
jgi:predicted RNA-binding Zn-ribbon protein involved in translation (DUF1610 family)